MMIYRDIETDETLTRSDLEREFHRLKKGGYTESETIEEYIDNCLTRNNGTLEEIGKEQ